MKQPIPVEFDPSNSSFYIFVAVVFIWDMAADQVKRRQLDATAFTNKGGAMNFYSCHGNPDGWKREKVDGSEVDVLDLNPGNPWNAYRLELHQLLLLEK